ncbi:hypothetical protein BDR22DRAFT_811313, partial [Usnea florida]
LQDSTRYCNTEFRWRMGKRKSYNYGPIPTFVTNPGGFLKENATNVENIFSISGSPLRLQAVEAAFNCPPCYSKGLDRSGAAVRDESLPCVYRKFVS